MLFGVDDLHFESTGSAASGAGAEAGSAGPGVGGSGIGGSPSMGTGASTGGTAGAGAADPALVDSGLVARYYMDEAATGQAPLALVDMAPMPLSVPISYTGTLLGYVEVAGQRGLSWTTQSTSRASIPIDAAKIHTLLHGTQTVTVEAVIDSPMLLPNSPRLVWIGPAGGTSDGQLSVLLQAGVGMPSVNFNDPNVNQDTASSTDTLAGVGRVVLHVVVDTSQPLATDRARLYRDGLAMPLATGTVPPTQNATLDLGFGNELAIGNRGAGDRAFVGVVYYLAMYSIALSPADVANNAAILLGDDDTP